MTTDGRVDKTISRGVKTYNKWCDDTAKVGVYDTMECIYGKSNVKSSNGYM